MMRTSLSEDDLTSYVRRLVENHIPDGYEPKHDTKRLVNDTLERLEFCFERIHRKYFYEDGVVLFDHINGDQFSAFLYFLAHTTWRDTGDIDWPTRLFYLNKIMHGLDLYFSIQMPAVFRLVHPVGTVLGRATYGEYLVVYQNVGVGADEAGIYPQFGEGAVLYSRTSVVGDCKIGKNVVFAANAFVLNTDIPDDSVVVGQYPDHRLISNSRSVMSRHFS